MLQSESETRAIHLQTQEYEYRRDAVIDGIVERFEKEGIVTHSVIVGLALLGIQPHKWCAVRTYGDVLDEREYNLRGDEWLWIWKEYRAIHNYNAGQCCSEATISFDPVSWRDLAYCLVEGAKKINRLSDVILQPLS